MYKFINESNQTVTYVNKISGLRLILVDNDKQRSVVTKLSIHIFLDSPNSDNIIILEKIYQSYNDALGVSERIQNIFETTSGVENEVITFKY